MCFDRRNVDIPRQNEDNDIQNIPLNMTTNNATANNEIMIVQPQRQFRMFPAVETPENTRLRNEFLAEHDRVIQAEYDAKVQRAKRIKAFINKLMIGQFHSKEGERLSGCHWSMTASKRVRRVGDRRQYTMTIAVAISADKQTLTEEGGLEGIFHLKPKIAKLLRTRLVGMEDSIINWRFIVIEPENLRVRQKQCWYYCALEEPRVVPQKTINQRKIKSTNILKKKATMSAGKCIRKHQVYIKDEIYNAYVVLDIGQNSNDEGHASCENDTSRKILERYREMSTHVKIMAFVGVIHVVLVTIMFYWIAMICMKEF